MAKHALTTSRTLDVSKPGAATSRRSLLAVAGPAALVLGGAAAAAPAVSSPDAELVALCARLDALEREFLATDFAAMPNTPEGDHAEAEQDRIADAQAPIVDAICARPPRTAAGAAAVAHSLALWDAELFRDAGPGGYTNKRLVAVLVRGLTGRAAA